MDKFRKEQWGQCLQNSLPFGVVIFPLAQADPREVIPDSFLGQSISKHCPCSLDIPSVASLTPHPSALQCSSLRPSLPVIWAVVLCFYLNSQPRISDPINPHPPQYSQKDVPKESPFFHKTIKTYSHHPEMVSLMCDLCPWQLGGCF